MRKAIEMDRMRKNYEKYLLINWSSKCLYKRKECFMLSIKHSLSSSGESMPFYPLKYQKLGENQSKTKSAYLIGYIFKALLYNTKKFEVGRISFWHFLDLAMIFRKTSREIIYFLQSFPNVIIMFHFWVHLSWLVSWAVTTRLKCEVWFRVDFFVYTVLLSLFFFFSNQPEVDTDQSGKFKLTIKQYSNYIPFWQGSFWQVSTWFKMVDGWVSFLSFFPSSTCNSLKLG